jgi:hypothetical protein
MREMRNLYKTSVAICEAERPFMRQDCNDNIAVLIFWIHLAQVSDELPDSVNMA